MTVPQQTQFKFSPTVKKNSAKSIAKTTVQTTLTSPAHHADQITATAPLPPDLPTIHEKPSHATAIPSVQTTGNEYESDRSDTAKHENNFNAHHLVDITPAKVKHHIAAGRPKKSTLDLFLQKCFREWQPGKHLHRVLELGAMSLFRTETYNEPLNMPAYAINCPKTFEQKQNNWLPKVHFRKGLGV